MNQLKMKEMWNARYSAETFVYGKAPNDFFKESLNRLNLSGNLLLPAEGEGRNAVFAAAQGLSVLAFDISHTARDKALKLAAERAAHIRYEVGTITDLGLEAETFDAAALIYAHQPPPLRVTLHQEIGRVLKVGGIVILEGFSKNNLELRQENPAIGGPNKVEMLFSVGQIQADFPNFEIVELQEVDVELQEGELHNGVGRVVRFIGRKREDN